MEEARLSCNKVEAIDNAKNPYIKQQEEARVIFDSGSNDGESQKMKDIILQFIDRCELSSAVINGPSAEHNLKLEVSLIQDGQMKIEDWAGWQVVRMDLGG